MRLHEVVAHFQEQRDIAQAEVLRLSRIIDILKTDPNWKLEEARINGSGARVVRLHPALTTKPKRKSRWTPAMRKRHSRLMKRKHKTDPAFHAKMVAAIRKAHKDAAALRKARKESGV
jgi:hypothetical protein